MSGLKDAGHLFRFLGLFVIAFLLFWVIRGYVVPKSFGEYGHYRGAAITDIASHPIKFAGHQACEQCHTDEAAAKSKGAHAHVNCEACHGAIFQLRRLRRRRPRISINAYSALPASGCRPIHRW